MKTINFLLLSLFFAIFARGQQITNSGFENWTSHSLYGLEDYFDSADDGNDNIIRETDAVSGNYSVKLETRLDDDGDFIFGYFINFDPDGFTGGQAYTQHVDSIVGYYKAHLVAQDTAWLVMGFKNNGNMIGGGIFPFTANNNTNTWTRFKYDTQMSASITPDTLIAGAVSSNALGEVGIEAGSWIQFDNIKFYDGGVEVTPMNNNDFENWNTVTYESPDDYDTSLKWNVVTTPLSIEKTNDATEGLYALKLNTVVTTIDQDTISGLITNGVLHRSWPPNGGLPVSQAPDSISFDYQNFRISNLTDDFADVSFYFKYQGNVVQQYGRTYRNTTTGYRHDKLDTPYTQPIDTLLYTTWNGAIPGSYFIIDNIVLHYNTGSTPNLTVERLVTFPNPAADKLWFKIRAIVPEKIKIILYDINGKEVLSNNFSIRKGLNSLQLHIDKLSSGNYLYQIITDKGKLSGKFVKR